MDDLVVLQASLKPTDGLMGFGKRADSDPCHARFSDRLELKLREIAEQAPSSQETAELMRFVYEAAKKSKEDVSAYWMLVAVHGHTAVLIPLLSSADATELSRLYLDRYPKYSLLPMQKRLVGQLQEQSGKAPRQKKGLASLFKKSEWDT